MNVTDSDRYGGKLDASALSLTQILWPVSQHYSNSCEIEEIWPVRKSIAPDSTWAAFGNNPITERELMDLPDPDSPTIPNVSPFCKVNEIWSTAFTCPRMVSNAMQRSRT